MPGGNGCVADSIGNATPPISHIDESLEICRNGVVRDCSNADCRAIPRGEPCGTPNIDDLVMGIGL